MHSAVVTDAPRSSGESEGSLGLSTSRSSRLGAWLAGQGVAPIFLAVSVAVAVAWLVMGVGPRFSGAPLRLPPQYTLWDSYSKPAAVPAAPGSPAELGVLLRPTVAGTIFGLRFYKAAGDRGPHVGRLWSAKGKQLASVTFANETDAGWQEAHFAMPVPVEANRLLIASYFSPSGGQMTSPDDGAPIVSKAPVFRLPPTDDRPTNLFHSGEPGFPSTDAGERAIWVDIVFVPALADR